MAKKKLRELSRQELSIDEFETSLSALESPATSDMIVAILAATLVEYQLEQVIKLNFRRSDSSTWSRMTDSAGPLRDFHSKIVLGHALSSFDEHIRQNLNIVRDVRNAFAHSRMLLSFDHSEIDSELRKIKVVRKGKRILHSGALSVGASRRAYLELCMSLLMFFQLKLNDSVTRKTKRINDKVRMHETMKKLVAKLNTAKS